MNVNVSEQVKCQCGVRPAAECAGAWEPGCDLGTAGETVSEVITAARSEVAEPEELGFVHMPRSADEAECMAKLGRMWLEANAPDRIKPGAPVDGRPVAWVRFCSDGGIEGPIMDSGMENVRRKSGAWTPLGVMGTGPQPAPLTPGENARAHADRICLRYEDAQPAQEPAAWHLPTEAQIDEFLEDYEMCGESEDGRDACYTPTDGERALIKDAIMGLLAGAAPTQAAPAPGVAELVETWRGLYRRAVNEANGLTNYVEDRPELRRAERNLTAIESEARAALARYQEDKP